MSASPPILWEDMEVLALTASLIAAATNLVVARRLHRLDVGAWVVRVYLGVFALFYAGAWAVLLAGEVDRGRWSEFLTPFTITTFVTVWIADAISDLIGARRIERMLAAVDHEKAEG